MSRTITIINEKLKERATVGQGWEGFWLWTDDKETVLALNYMANKAMDTDTTLRFVDEYQIFDNDDETIYKYEEVSKDNMQAWLNEHHPRYYKLTQDSNNETEAS